MGVPAYQDEAATDARSHRQWRTAVDSGGPQGHPTTSQTHTECADSDIGASASATLRIPSAPGRNGPRSTIAQTMVDRGRLLRAAYHRPHWVTLQRLRRTTNVLTRTSRRSVRRRRLEEAHQLGHRSPDRKDPRLAQANSTNPSRPLDDAASAPHWMGTTNTRTPSTSSSQCTPSSSTCVSCATLWRCPTVVLPSGLYAA